MAALDRSLVTTGLQFVDFGCSFCRCCSRGYCCCKDLFSKFVFVAVAVTIINTVIFFCFHCFICRHPFIVFDVLLSLLSGTAVVADALAIDAVVEVDIKELRRFAVKGHYKVKLVMDLSFMFQSI